MNQLAITICRACLSKEGPFLSVFTIDEGAFSNVTFADMIMASSPTVRINSNDRLPTEICTQCAEKLLKSYRFKLTIEESDVFLRSQAIILDEAIQKQNLNGGSTSKNNCYDVIEIEEDSEDDLSFEEENYTSDDSTMDSDVEKEMGTIIEKPADVEKNFHFCQKCSKIVKDVRTLKEHICGGASCDNCGEKFTNKKELRLHERQHIKDRLDKLRSCKYCKKQFKHMRSLNKHLLVHNKPFECDKCNKKFTCEKYLKEHYNLHSGAKPFKCEVCSKKFSLSRKLQLHLLTHAEKERSKSFKCEQCDCTYAFKNSLMKHMKTHN